MRKFILILCSIIIFAVIFTGIKIIYTEPEKMLPNDELKGKLENIVEKKESDEKVIIEMNKITAFDWDKLYIIPPYRDKEEFFENKNIEDVGLIDSNIYGNDSIKLLVFVLDNKVVSYINYPRNKGDFDIAKEHREDGYTPNEAVFEVKKENDWFEIVLVKHTK